MDYSVKQEIKDAVAAILKVDAVQKAMEFTKEDQTAIVDKQCELTLIPSPTFHEEVKAKRLLEMFIEEGLSDCHIDEFGNCVGIRKGTGNGKPVLLEGHMDTVFAMDTELNLRRENGWVYCPGISDDNRGLAVCLAVVRALNAANIETVGDIHVVGTVREEGMGGMGGMQYYVQHHPELKSSISVDGTGFSDILYQSTGCKTIEVTFHGVGGHAHAAYGTVANPIHAAARAITKIAEFRTNAASKTTVAVTNLEAGNLPGIHAIVKDATIRMNYRSNSPEDLEELDRRIFAVLNEACAEETARWEKDTISYTVKTFLDVKCDTQSNESPIVQAAYHIAECLGREPHLLDGGSTNCSRALEADLPAVCLGEGDDYPDLCHSTLEQFREEGSYVQHQATILLTLACAGMDEIPSIIQ